MINLMSGRAGFGLLLRSTALAGATLCWCAIAADPAFADTARYAYGDTDDSQISPQDGGVWDTTSENWRRQNSAGKFKNGDDAIFSHHTGGAVGLTLGESVSVSSITFESGDYTITNPGGYTISSALNNQGESVLRDIVVETGAKAKLAARLEGRFAVTVEKNSTLELNNAGDGIESVTVDAKDGPDPDGYPAGKLVLRGVTIRNTLENNGTVELRGNATVGDIDTPDGGVVNAGTISAAGGQRTLLVNGTLVNKEGATLSGGTGQDSLTINANLIQLDKDSTVDGSLILNGAIDSRIVLDMAMVPILGGNFENRVGGAMNVNGDVDGARNDVTNSGKVEIFAGGRLDNVKEFRNGRDNSTDGSVVVAAGGWLGADLIVHLRTGIRFVSNGTLDGRVELNKAATITNKVIGQLSVNHEDAVVTVDADLGVTRDDLTPESGILVDVRSGTLRLVNAATLTTALVRNQDIFDFGADGTVAGDFNNFGDGIIQGTGIVTGNLTLNGDSGIDNASSVSVQGNLVNNRTGITKLSELGKFDASTIENRARLDIDEETSDDLVNASGTMNITSNVSGSVRSDATLNLTGSSALAPLLSKGLVVNGGNTTVNGDILITNSVWPNAVTVNAGGKLNVTQGTLSTVGNVVANGGTIEVGRDDTLITSRLSVQSGDAILRGTVSDAAVPGAPGVMVVGDAGVAHMDGAIVNVGVQNHGRIDMASDLQNRGLRLNAGLNNEGYASLGSRAQRATINGEVTNSGRKIQGEGLYVVGNITGSLSNRGYAEITGNIGQLTNRDTGVITVAGNIGSAFDNLGSATLVGSNVTGALANKGRLTLQGAVTADSLSNEGRLNIDAGADVTAGDPATVVVENRSGGTMQIEGRLANAVTNRSGANLTLNGSGNIQRSLVNEGTAQLAGGTITGLTTNKAGATMNVTGGVVAGRKVTNEGNLNIRQQGILTGNVDNASGGTIISRGEITGNLINDGIFRVAGNATVGGDFVNEGLLSQTENGSILTIGGTLTNNGDITAGAFDAMTINAEEVNVAGVGGVGEGVTINANIIVSGTLIYDEQQSILKNLKVGSTGRLIVSALVDGNGTAQIENEGVLSIQSDGNLTRLDRLTNRNSATVASGGSIGARTIVNENGGTFTNRGTVSGVVTNRANSTFNSTGIINGNLTNAGTLNLTNKVAGDISNSAIMNTTGHLTVTGNIQNTGTVTVGGTESLTSRQLTNARGGTVNAAGGLSGTIVNKAGGKLTSTGGITGTLSNQGAATLAGTVTGLITNNGSGTLTFNDVATAASGIVNEGDGTVKLTDTAVLAGTITNRSVVELAGRVIGDINNERGEVRSAGNASVQGTFTNGSGPSAAPKGRLSAPGASALFRVNAGDTVAVTEGTINEAGARIDVLGTLISDITNRGALNSLGTIRGDVTTSGNALLRGKVDGNLTFTGGSFDINGALNVSGAVNLEEDLRLGRDTQLTAGRLNNYGQLTLQGIVNAPLTNTASGVVVVNGSQAINGTVTNNGVVTLDNEVATDVLTVNGGLSGAGKYQLDVDLTADGGKGRSDVIVVNGGAVTGTVLMHFDTVGDPAKSRGDSILVMDLDESEANNFKLEATGLPIATEEIVYGLRQTDNAVYMDQGTNPAYGSIAGNIVLTQSLIGSVVNRPTSPFVQGYAVAEEEPCGVGAWARATGGKADATGSSTNGNFTMNSSISAKYAGLQFGGDFACFQGKYNGWDMAFGVIGGVNDGSTSQPIYLQDSADPSKLTKTVASINEADFRQMYGGVYVTASRDRLSADLQLRRERTDFTINNSPKIPGSSGLRLTDAEFESNATTLSGSMTYAIPLQQEGLQFVPTAGFALTNTSTDAITLDNGSRLEIKDSKSRVAFVGGTLSKSRVLKGGTSALNYFGTATVYKDFADSTESVFTRYDADGSVRSREELTSDNLGAYGELSVGANYVRVLEPGRFGRAKQLNASVRVDGRSGDSLDSYGVTAQVRLQF